MYHWPQPGCPPEFTRVLLQLEKHLPWSSPPFINTSPPSPFHPPLSPPSLHRRLVPLSTPGELKRTSRILTPRELATSLPVISPNLWSTLPAAQVIVTFLQIRQWRNIDYFLSHKCSISWYDSCPLLEINCLFLWFSSNIICWCSAVPLKPEALFFVK